MRSAVAPESRRAQASASSIMMSAMVSMPMIHIQQLRWYSIMFLPCREICGRQVWTGKGEGSSFTGPNLLFPTHFNFLFFIWFEGSGSECVTFIPVVLDGPFVPGACLPLLVFAGPWEVFQNSGSYISHSSSLNRCLTLLHLKHQPVNVSDACATLTAISTSP